MKVKEIQASTDTIRKKLQEIFENESQRQTFNSRGSISIENPLIRKITFDRDLTSVLRLSDKEKGRLKIFNFINHLFSISKYFINFDILDKDENLFNGKPSTLLECFDVIGDPFKRVSYSKTNQSLKKKFVDW